MQNSVCDRFWSVESHDNDNESCTTGTHPWHTPRTYHFSKKFSFALFCQFEHSSLFKKLKFRRRKSAIFHISFLGPCKNVSVCVDSKNFSRRSNMATSTAGASRFQVPTTQRSAWNWKSFQVIGDERSFLQRMISNDENAIPDVDNEFTCLAFNQDGTQFAAGTRGGCVSVLKWKDEVGKYLEHVPTWQAHEHEYNYADSIEFKKKVTALQFLARTTPFSQLLLSASQKAVRLWKVKEVRTLRQSSDPSSVKCSMQREWKHMHDHHIHTVSEKNDQQLFLCADPMCINVMHLEHDENAQTVVEVSNPKTPGAPGTITCAVWSPAESHDLAYSTSRGAIHLCDYRMGSRCDQHPKVLQPVPEVSTFYGEFTRAISSIKFSKDGNLVLGRDFNNVKIWDVRSEGEPVYCAPVHNWLDAGQNFLFDMDCLYDQFDVDWSDDGRMIVTGTYNRMFRAIDPVSGESSLCEASTDEDTRRTLIPIDGTGGSCVDDDEGKTIDSREINLQEQALRAKVHPVSKIVAIASCDSLFFMRQQSAHQ